MVGETFQIYNVQITGKCICEQLTITGLKRVKPLSTDMNTNNKWNDLLKGETMLEMSSELPFVELPFVELCLVFAGLGVDFDTVLTGVLSRLFLVDLVVVDLVVSIVKDLLVDPLVERVLTGLLMFGDFTFLFDLALPES